MEKTINKELKKLSLWLNVNRLALNISKTNFVIFAAKNKAIKNVTLLLNKMAIQQVEYVKYLGVLIDSRLTFTHHVNSVSKKMSRMVGLMYRIRKCVNNKTMFLIYYSLIYPHLLYGVPIWGNANDTHLAPLKRLQKKAIRLILNKERNIHILYELPGDPATYWYIDSFMKVPTGPLFKQLQILKIADIYKSATLNFVYDSIHKLNPVQFHNYYQFSEYIEHNTSTIRQNNLNIPMVRTTNYGLKSIQYSGCILWNALPLSEKTKKISKKTFVKRIKNYFIGKYE